MKELIEAGLLGILAGLAAGFFGVGGGIVFVPIGSACRRTYAAGGSGSSWTAILPTSALCANRYRIGKEVAWNLAEMAHSGSAGRGGDRRKMGESASGTTASDYFRVVFTVYGDKQTGERMDEGAREEGFVQS